MFLLLSKGSSFHAGGGGLDLSPGHPHERQQSYHYPIQSPVHVAGVIKVTLTSESHHEVKESEFYATICHQRLFNTSPQKMQLYV